MIDKSGRGDVFTPARCVVALGTLDQSFERATVNAFVMTSPG
jgi:hypothetical protein